jgi:ketosteroid isomerase-like protein
MVTTRREEMDRAVDEHFAFEANDDVDGVLASLADGVEHEVIPSPFGTHSDPAKIRSYYEMLFGCSRGESTTPVRRLYGDDFLVDETIWRGYIEDGRPFLCPGKSGPVSFRILHVFRFRQGKISLEQAWLDLAAIQQQLGCKVS